MAEGHGQGFRPSPGTPVQQHDLVVTNSALWALASCGWGRACEQPGHSPTRLAAAGPRHLVDWAAA